MFKRNIIELKKIYEQNKVLLKKIKNEDDELYIAFRSDENQNKDYISIYYGSVVFALLDKNGIGYNYSDSIKKGAQEFFEGLDKCADKNEYYFEKRKLLKDAIEETSFYKRQAERNKETLLGKKFDIDSDKRSVVLDVEAKIPEDEGIVGENNNKKSPEIDMVVYDSIKNVIYLTEYKCKERSVKDNKAGIIQHYSDMKQIIEKCGENFVKSEIDVYNMMTGKTIDYRTVKLKIALCFSDINRKKIVNALDGIENKDEIYVWYGDELEDVQLSVDPITVSEFIKNSSAGD